MQRKNISILLFILVFVGVALLGNTRVWAAIDDCVASEAGLCAEVLDKLGNPIYVIRICEPDGSGSCTADLADVDIPGDWPLMNGDGTKTYTYSFMQHAEASSTCTGVPALNYVYFTMLDGIPPIVASDPSGPKLYTCEDGLKDCAEECNPNTIRVKLSFSYSCTKESRGEPAPRLFSITMPPGTNDDTTCGSVTAVTRDGCKMSDNNSIIVPLGATTFVDDFSFPGGTFHVTRDICTGEFESITDDNNVFTFQDCTPYICFGPPQGPDYANCINVAEKRVGPPFFGCVLDDLPIPMYGYGYDYRCGYPLSSSP